MNQKEFDQPVVYTKQADLHKTLQFLCDATEIDMSTAMVDEALDVFFGLESTSTLDDFINAAEQRPGLKPMVEDYRNKRARAAG